ncbi:MAG: ATP-binding cassette domain-containing protein [Tannerellaceae bacterium]|jgi:ABC-type lipoprotein export system ATPase subunit|nr:ATP-binding cassette domain-containing protein [Tannerellaceae bacterium]
MKHITLIGGKDKDGMPEDVTLTLAAGTVTAIVGPTGSGKSRLLADIEWLAQGDTPTGRQVLVDGIAPCAEERFDTAGKLVAQLSQNMNFVMDASVGDFLRLHAESRSPALLTRSPEEVAASVVEQANRLAGEPLTEAMPLTALSGGQSRALMIADVAFLSQSPIVLIDEIENAGIDRRNALALLISKDKIVLIATHDPMLALMAHQRLAIRNGSIRNILRTSPREKSLLASLEVRHQELDALRHSLRLGLEL